jgi:hypothetical protein
MPELLSTLPGKLSIPSSLEEPPVPTRKSPSLMTESQIRKLTSAPTREPTLLVAHRKIANLKISHIESIDKLQVSHEGFLKVNIKGVPKEIPIVPSGAKLKPPDPAPAKAALTRELTSAPTREPPGIPSASTRESPLILTSEPLALPSKMPIVDPLVLIRELTSAPTRRPLAPSSTKKTLSAQKPLAPPSTKKAISAPVQEPLTLISTNLQSRWNTALTPTKGQSSPTTSEKVWGLIYTSIQCWEHPNYFKLGSGKQPFILFHKYFRRLHDVL